MTRSRTRQAAEGTNTKDSDAEKCNGRESGARPPLQELRLKDPARAHHSAVLPIHYKPAGREEKERYTGVIQKERKLKDPDFQRSLQSSGAAQAAAATLLFAQYDAGTAVCTSPTGLLLTCAHCIADADEDETGVGVKKWLLFASGHPVIARCVAWDPKRDLALLQIIAQRRMRPHPAIEAQDPDWHLKTNMLSSLPFLSIATSPPTPKVSLHCIGHPGSEDLEASTSGIETDYDVLHISSGRFLGMAKGQDPQDNSEIGALKHDCWTYWGHSGAPLVERREREWVLVGLHSSWDDQSGVRRGVGLEALREFLGEHVDGLEGS